MKFLMPFFSLFLFSVQVTAESAFDKGLALLNQKNFGKAAQSFYTFLEQSELNDSQKAKTEINLALAVEKSGFGQAAVMLIRDHTKSMDSLVASRSFEILARLSIIANDSGLRELAMKNISTLKFNELTSQEFILIKIQDLIDQDKLDSALSLINSEELQSSSDLLQVLYLRGLIYLKINKPDLAFQEFQKIFLKISAPLSKSREKSLALISMARAKYQSLKFDQASELYRQIPKDSEFFRESQLELAWSYFREARFRSSLGVIETVHTPFYKHFWDPESYLIQAIIHLYACQGEQATEAMDQFKQNYQIPTSSVEKWLVNNFQDIDVLAEWDQARTRLQNIKLDKKESSNKEAKLPFSLVRTVMLDAATSSKVQLINLVKEQQKLLINKNTIQRLSWKNGLVSKLNLALKVRQQELEQDLKQALINGLKQRVNAMKELSAQADFIRYEILNLKRKDLKQKLASNDKGSTSMEKQFSRNVLVENGYRYWPQSTEYWADEIGNTYYLGASRCEK